MSTAIPGISACVFDAYGTLFDVHAAVAAHRQRAGAVADALSQTWRTRQLEYTWLRSLMARHADFWQVTRDALDYACARHGLDDDRLKADLMAAYLELAAYPDVPGCLQALGARGLKRAILSNGTPTMLAAAVDKNRLGPLLDAVLSVEAVGIYKPAPQVYQLAVDRLDVPADRICFLSSNAWDAVAAKSFGCRVAWVNRKAEPLERLGFTPDAEIQTLADLPALLA